MTTDLFARLRGWPRRMLALCCLLLAAGSALTARHAAARTVPGAPVVVAAHDLVAGSALSAADVRVVTWPASARPANALHTTADAVGRRVAGAIAAGEAVTTTRVLGAGVTTGLPPGLVATTIALSGPGTAALIRAGDVVDLMVADQSTTDPTVADQPTTDQSTTGPPTTAGQPTDPIAADRPHTAGAHPAEAPPPAAQLLAAQVRVLAVVPVADDSASEADTAVVIAVDRPTALRIAALAGRPVLAAVHNSP